MPPAIPQSTATTAATAGGGGSASASGANHRQGNSNSNLNPNKIDLKNPNNFNRAINSRLSSVDTDMPDPNSSTGNPAGRPSSSNALTPIKIDGWEEDAILARSKFLHRMEVLKRRHRRTKQLQRIYRDCYWSLMEEVKLKHREYCWKYGMSAFQEEEDKSNKDETLGTEENNANPVNGTTCDVQGCKSKSMALTKFCHMHILSDCKQRLYKPCNYAIKSIPIPHPSSLCKSQSLSSAPTGPILCGKPILRSAVPSYCSLHFQKSEKNVTRALKKAGLNASNTSKIAPKFHVIVAEYVSHIQNKRRAAQNAATLEIAEVKEENNSS